MPRIVIRDAIVIDNTTGVADEGSFINAQRNRYPIPHETFGAEAQAEALDRLCREAATQKIRMARFGDSLTRNPAEH